MRRFSLLARQSGFLLMLFFLWGLLLGWPVITIPEGRNDHTILLYLFWIWGLGIVLLFLVARLIIAGTGPNGRDRNEVE